MTLITGGRRISIELLQTLGIATQQAVESITRLALKPAPATSEAELLARLATHFLLFDLEILCWPWLQLDPVWLLRAHSVRGGLNIVVWPPAATVRALDRALTLPILNAAYRVSSTAYPAHERASS